MRTLGRRRVGPSAATSLMVYPLCVLCFVFPASGELPNFEWREMRDV
jgi:hypothetical protein